MVSMLVITLFVLSDTISYNRTLLQPHQRKSYQKYKMPYAMTNATNVIIARYIAIFSITSFGGADGNRTHVLQDALSGHQTNSCIL